MYLTLLGAELKDGRSWVRRCCIGEARGKVHDGEEPGPGLVGTGPSNGTWWRKRRGLAVADLGVRVRALEGRELGHHCPVFGR